MSRHFAVLGKTPPMSSEDSAGAPSAVGPCEYTELIQRLFQRPAVVAIVGTGFSSGVTGICQGIASELSRLNKRVVLVSVSSLLQANPLALSNETSSLPELGHNVWLWPSPAGQPIEFFKARNPIAAKNWLDSLRQNFESILLDCPPLESSPRGAAIAAMAEAAVLVVDAARTSKHRILLDQRVLQLSGVKLAGCILTNAK